MAEPFDQVGAAVPRLRLRGIGLELAGVEKERVPGLKAGPDIEREHQARLFRRRARRRDGVQEGADRQHVVAGRFGEPLIGERRIEVAAIPVQPLMHRAIKLIVAPGADPIGFVRRDVGGVKRPVRRMDRRAPGVGLAPRRGMAGFAIAGAGEIGAPLDERRIGPLGGGGGAKSDKDCADCGRCFGPHHVVTP